MVHAETFRVQGNGGLVADVQRGIHRHPLVSLQLVVVLSMAEVDPVMPLEVVLDVVELDFAVAISLLGKRVSAANYEVGVVPEGSSETVADGPHIPPLSC
jgi:hypothetical protein